MQISPQRIEEIYQEILNRANKRGQGFTTYSQYEATKMRALAEVWKKYAQAGDNPVALAEAKRFEADTIHDLDLKNINNLRIGGVSQFTINDQLKQAEQRYGMSLAQVQNMRAAISGTGSESKGPKFGEEGWWSSFNNYIKGLIGFGPRTGAPNGIPEAGGQRGGRPGLDFGYWGTLFYGMFNSVKDSQGNYLAHPELIPGIPETGKNAQFANIGIQQNVGGNISGAINQLLQQENQINSPLEQWEQQRNQNNLDFTIGSSS